MKESYRPWNVFGVVGNLPVNGVRPLSFPLRKKKTEGRGAKRFLSGLTFLPFIRPSANAYPWRPFEPNAIVQMRNQLRTYVRIPVRDIRDYSLISDRRRSLFRESSPNISTSSPVHDFASPDSLDIDQFHLRKVTKLLRPTASPTKF